MKEQHKAILKELIAGKYTGDEPAEGKEEKKEEMVSVASMAEPEMKKNQRQNSG